ncbi:erythrocyte binding protein, partial [Reticulomyxa filosa]
MLPKRATAEAVADKEEDSDEHSEVDEEKADVYVTPGGDDNDNQDEAEEKKELTDEPMASVKLQPVHSNSNVRTAKNGTSTNSVDLKLDLNSKQQQQQQDDDESSDEEGLKVFTPRTNDERNKHIEKAVELIDKFGYTDEEAMRKAAEFMLAERMRIKRELELLEERKRKELEMRLAAMSPEEREDYDRNERQKKITLEQLNSMSLLSVQIREAELTRRRLLFQEYPLPHRCKRCGLTVTIVYVLLMLLITVILGFNLGNSSTTVTIQSSQTTSSSARRLAAVDNQHVSVDISDTAFSDTLTNSQCQFVSTEDRIIAALASAYSGDSSSSSSDAYSSDKNSGTRKDEKSKTNQAVKWLWTSIVGVIIGTFLWQPLLLWLVSWTWATCNKKHELAHGLNNLCCGVAQLYKHTRVRVFAERYRDPTEDFTPGEISSLLFLKDKEIDRAKLAERRRLKITLDRDGNIIRYRELNVSRTSRSVPYAVKKVDLTTNSTEKETKQPSGEEGGTSNPAPSVEMRQYYVVEIDAFAIESGMLDIQKSMNIKELQKNDDNETKTNGSGNTRGSALDHLSATVPIIPAGHNREFFYSSQHFLLPGLEMFALTQQQIIEWLPYIKLKFIDKSKAHTKLKSDSIPVTCSSICFCFNCLCVCMYVCVFKSTVRLTTNEHDANDNADQDSSSGGDENAASAPADPNANVQMVSLSSNKGSQPAAAKANVNANAKANAN